MDGPPRVLVGSCCDMGRISLRPWVRFPGSGEVGCAKRWFRPDTETGPNSPNKVHVTPSTFHLTGPMNRRKTRLLKSLHPRGQTLNRRVKNHVRAMHRRIWKQLWAQDEKDFAQFEGLTKILTYGEVVEPPFPSSLPMTIHPY